MRKLRILLLLSIILILNALTLTPYQSPRPGNKWTSQYLDVQSFDEETKAYRVQLTEDTLIALAFIFSSTLTTEIYLTNEAETKVLLSEDGRVITP